MSDRAGSVKYLPYRNRKLYRVSQKSSKCVTLSHLGLGDSETYFSNWRKRYSQRFVGKIYSVEPVVDSVYFEIFENGIICAYTSNVNGRHVFLSTDLLGRNWEEFHEILVSLQSSSIQYWLSFTTPWNEILIIVVDFRLWLSAFKKKVKCCQCSTNYSH